jgi:predicted MFS family arabinose efflux permease
MIAAGYADFPLIAFHLAKQQIVAVAWIPVLYSLGNVMAGAAAVWLGHAYDRRGLRVLVHATLVPALFAPLVMLGSAPAVVLGMVLWGVGFGAHDTLLRAAVADRVAKDQRASVLGAFNACYGLAWFAGSALLGLLYDLDPSWLVAVSLTLQWGACLLLLRLPAPAKYEIQP